MEDPGKKIAIVRDAFLATAAWIDMEAAIKNAESASLRGDAQGIEDARRRAHDFLDSNIDLKIAAHTAIRSANEG